MKRNYEAAWSNSGGREDKPGSDVRDEIEHISCGGHRSAIYGACSAHCNMDAGATFLFRWYVVVRRGVRFYNM